MTRGLATLFALAAAPPLARAEAQQPNDSLVYHVTPESRFEVLTGRAGLLAFAGHEHVIRARRFSGTVVFFPDRPERSRVDIRVLAESLEVLTPPDTAEIRKVTETMRTRVLRVAEHPEIRLRSSAVTVTPTGVHLLAALTLVGETRSVPVDVTVRRSADTLRASGRFSVKQSEFGIKPYAGGPGGTVQVADRVDFTIDVLAVRAADGGLREDERR
jgi:polyisoprenoid-binding protein YceI